MLNIGVLPLFNMTERKKYDLTGLTESYPGIYYWKDKKYILVKDGEHYLIPYDRLQRMVKESHGHHSEIVRDYKPRKRKPRDPNAPPRKRKSKDEINNTEDVNKAKYTCWIHPDYIDRKNDAYEYTEHGHRLGLQKWAIKAGYKE